MIFFYWYFQTFPDFFYLLKLSKSVLEMTTWPHLWIFLRNKNYDILVTPSTKKHHFTYTVSYNSYWVYLKWWFNSIELSVYITARLCIWFVLNVKKPLYKYTTGVRAKVEWRKYKSIIISINRPKNTIDAPPNKHPWALIMLPIPKYLLTIFMPWFHSMLLIHTWV